MNKDTRMINTEQLKQQAIELRLHSLQHHWQELKEEHIPLLSMLLGWKHDERQQRSLERRLNSAKLGRFKPINEFEWQWPTKIDQPSIHALMQINFFKILLYQIKEKLFEKKLVFT